MYLVRYILDLDLASTMYLARYSTAVGATIIVSTVLDLASIVDLAAVVTTAAVQYYM